MTEGSSFDVLSSDSDTESLLQEGGPGETLSCSEIESNVVLEGGVSEIVDLLNVAVDIQQNLVLGDVVYLFIKFPDGFDGETSGALVRLELLEVLESQSSLLEFAVTTVLQLGNEEILVNGFHLLDLLFSPDTLAEHGGFILVVDGWDRINNLVHHGLSETWLIEFVVSVLSVSDDIDDNILLEFLSVLEGQFEDLVNKFWSISVNVEDWSLNGFSQISTIERSSILCWNSGKTNLVIDNNMNETSTLIAFKVLELE